MVHQTRLELARIAPYAPQAYVSADSTTGASLKYNTIIASHVNNLFAKIFRPCPETKKVSDTKSDTSSVIRHFPDNMHLQNGKCHHIQIQAHDHF